MNGYLRMASPLGGAAFGCAVLILTLSGAEAAPAKKPRTCVEICQMLTGPGGRNDYSHCMSRCTAYTYSRRTETLAPRPGARPESATGRDPAAHRQAGVPKAACSVARWRFVWGTEGAVYMTTDGAICRTSVIRTSGTTEVHSIGITTQAKNGTAGASGRSVTYRPRPAFKGEDSFAFTIVGRRHGESASAPMRVHVTVR